MKMINCIHPKYIVNPYTGESCFVPCGKCSSCLNSKSLQWQQRLENEIRKYKYLYFVTLTYDDFHMHVLSLSENLHGKFYMSNDTNVVVPFDDVCEGFYVYDKKRVENIDYLNSRPFIPHLFKPDVSSFVKRLRSCIHYNFKINNIQENEKISFYACGEYGESTYRPHMHLLFWFNSQFLSNNIVEYIHKCWQFGSSDVKAADSRVSQYVTKYCNSFGSLPQIYLHEQIRPFNLCSKRSPVGFTAFNESQIQRIFREGIVEIPVWCNSRKKSVYVRLWRSLENKLFPKFKGFNSCSHRERVRLFSINTCNGLESARFSDFFRKVQTYVCSCAKDFPFDEISETKRGSVAQVTFDVCLLYKYGFLDTDINGEYTSLRNLYYLSRSCLKRAYLLGLSMDAFVSCIERYYEKLNMYNLHQQIFYEDEMLRKKQISLRDLIYLDLRFVKRIVDSDNRYGLSKSVRLLLESFGFENPQNDSFYTLVDVVRKYVDEHPLTSLTEYQNFKSLHERIYASSVKNKVKKDTLDYYANNELYSFTKL